ncbi:apolipoprotein N-acyltransferase [Rhodoligotrophos appendicifer]|uniref:apolipoprotein N-acyltransferase n=1 Tax=Rhodoligotrophos appendicifer TaxID=987056 RepID=UPI00117D0B3F|nr:apolipoprotein N-acyltransferase [Rhodoligotrophos appendicifer]
MNILAARIRALTGWRSLAAAMAAGAASALAQPPLYIFPGLFLGVPVLVLLLDGACLRGEGPVSRLWSCFKTGWSFGFGYFLLSFYWVAEAFLVEAETYAWMIPFAVVLLPAGMALYWGAGAAAASSLWQRGAGRILALAACLTLTEWLRGVLFTGFPWSLPGYAMGILDGLAQSASVMGAYGLTFLVLVLAAIPVLALDHESVDRRRRMLPLAIIVAVLGVLWTGGAIRVAQEPADSSTHLRLRIVQPNIEQGQKWDPEHAQEVLSLFLRLSSENTKENPAGLDSINYVIWPESAVPYLVAERADVRGAIGAILPPDTMLFTGALRREPDPQAPDSMGIFYNSLLVLNGSGAVTAHYDKAHLVPFGEYLPFETWLKPLGFRRLVTLPEGFQAGEAAETLKAEAVLPFSPLICYEIVFPGAVVDGADRPAWLLNVTNDAWFGTSLGPHQHFAQARFRAIEEGLPLIRSANTGISAIVDPYGRIVKFLGLGERGVIDGELPTALPPTIYAEFGNWMMLFLIIPALLLSIRFKLTQLNTKRAHSPNNQAIL